MDSIAKRNLYKIYLLCLFCHFMAYAQEDSTASKVVKDYKSERFLILGRVVDEADFDSPRAFNIVDSKEILERAPRTPAEALRYKAGIWVQRTGHIGGAPIIRGFMGNRVLYVFDGIRRNTASIFGGPNSFLQTVDALDIDRIEVIRGPGSVLYGSDAIGGIINVETNEKALFSEQPTFGGRTYARYSSVDEQLSERQEFFFSTENVFFSIGATHREIGDVRAGDSEVTNPSNWREKNWDAQLDLKLAQNHQLELFVQDYKRINAARYDRPDRHEYADRELYGIRYVGHDIGFVDKAKFTLFRQEQPRYQLRDGFEEKDSSNEEVTHGVDLELTSHVTDDWTMVYGLMFHQDDIESTSPRRGTKDPDIKWQNAGIFLLNQYQATDRLKLELGLRYDQFRLQSKAPSYSELASTIQDAIDANELTLNDFELDDTNYAFTGGFGIVYEMTSHHNLVSHIGTAYRAPSRDMLNAGEFTFGYRVPTPGLQPERSWTYELGVKSSYDDFTSSVTGFYTRLYDAITSSPGTFGGNSFVDLNGNMVQDSNEAVYVASNSSDYIEAYGLEVEWNWYLPFNMPVGVLSTYGNFTWVEGDDNGEPLDREFPINALVGLRLDQKRGAGNKWWIAAEAWMVNDTTRIKSSRYNSDAAFKNDPQDSSSGLLRSGHRVPGFTVFNVHMGYEVFKNATLTVGVSNVFDKTYRVKDSRIDGPGMDVTVGFEYRF